MGLNLPKAQIATELGLAESVAQDMITQFEIHHTDPGLKFRWRFQRAMRVGQDHVAATVNALVLAYAGAALPTLLLFSISGTAIHPLLNLEFVTEEVARTLVRSLGLCSRCQSRLRWPVGSKAIL